MAVHRTRSSSDLPTTLSPLRDRNHVAGRRVISSRIDRSNKVAEALTKPDTAIDERCRSGGSDRCRRTTSSVH